MLRIVKVSTVSTVGVMAVLLGLAFFNAPAVARDQPSYHPDIEVRWTPSRLNATVKPGETVSIPVSFTAREKLDGVGVVFASTTLRDIVSVTPTSFDRLRKGQTATITVAVTLPILQGAGTSTGFIQLYDKSKRWKRPMPIQWGLPIAITTQCPCLPPDPGEAGKATIEGIDSDNDGVRDDVQRWIASAYVNSALNRAALTQLSLATEANIQARNSVSEANSAALRSELAVDCLTSLYGDSASAMIAELEGQYFNTDERTMALFSFEASASAPGAPILPRAQRRAACAFDPNSFSN